MGKVLASPGYALIYGILLWLLTFLVSVVIYPVKSFSTPLFDSLMPVALALFVVWFLNLYFRKVPSLNFTSGLIVGVVWLLISLIIDLFLFSYGPMAMSFTNYMYDIGLTYLLIPVITGGVGLIVDRLRTKPA